MTVPQDISDEIADLIGPSVRGFGSVRVEVRTGGSRWRTSVFPDKNTGKYVLPVKKAIQKAESIEAGDLARFDIMLIPE